MVSRVVNLFRAHIGVKIASGYLLIGLLVLACAGAGFFGLSTLSNTLEFLSGPAWNAADGAMEGTIQIEAQVIVINELVSGADNTSRDHDEAVRRLDEAREATREALDRMAATQLIKPESLTRLATLRTRFRGATDDLLYRHQALQTAKARFDKGSEQVSELVDALANACHTAAQFTPLSDLRNESEGPQAATQSQLRLSAASLPKTLAGQLRQVERLVGNSATDSNRDEIAEANRQLLGALEMLKSLNIHDPASVEAESVAKFGQLVSQLDPVLREHGKRTEETLVAHRALSQARGDYASTTTEFLDFIAELEEEGDSQVEGMTASIAASKRNASLTIIVSALFSLVIALVAGILCTRSFTKPIRETAAAFERLKDGDLTQRLAINRIDEFGALAGTFNDFADGIQCIMRGIAENAQTLSQSAQELTSTATQMAQGANGTTHRSAMVATAAQEMSVAMQGICQATESMSGNIQSVSTCLQEMSSTLQDLSQKTQKYSQDVVETSSLAETANRNISELWDAAENIGNVIELIDDLAEQTNLLALNATIEAARAGEAGKGFGVVATEVKELAKQTAKATNDIRTRIQAIQGSTKEAVQSITAINRVMGQISQMTDRIAAAVEEQSVSTHSIATTISATSTTAENVAASVSESNRQSQEITTSIASVDEIARETAEGAGCSLRAGSRLNELSHTLRSMVQRFQV